MDYKYIEQLLERYWQCETSLKEEEILRSFFMQEEVPAWLLHYKPLFILQQEKEQPLGDEFDERMMAIIDEMSEPVRAKTIRITHRLMPLFKAAAIVAIVLTLGNAAQAPWDRGWDDPKIEYAKYHQQLTDSSNVQPMQAENLVDSVNQSTGPLVPTY
jgi:hypothetical protein